MKPATSIAKVCRVLDTFRLHPAMGITDLAESSGLLPSDVHRILKSLQQFGYVHQDPYTKKYRLGMELLKLGHLVHARIELRNVARPFLLQLAEATETTVNLAVLNQSELEILFVEQIDSPNEVQVKVRTGARAAPHCTAVGKVIAAFMEPRFTELLLQKEGMVKRTKNTITDPEKLRRELADVRARGYATDREEAVEGACCVGAPVRDHRGEVVAAVSVSMMARRMRNWPEARLVSMVTATGAKISAALGYQRGSSAGRAPGAM